MDESKDKYADFEGLLNVTQPGIFEIMAKEVPKRKGKKAIIRKALMDSTYIRDCDIPQPMYDLTATDPMPELPAILSDSICKQSFCRLGCVCESINTETERNTDHYEHHEKSYWKTETEEDTCGFIPPHLRLPNQGTELPKRRAQQPSRYRPDPPKQAVKASTSRPRAPKRNVLSEAVILDSSVKSNSRADTDVPVKRGRNASIQTGSAEKCVPPRPKRQNNRKIATVNGFVDTASRDTAQVMLESKSSFKTPTVPVFEFTVTPILLNES